MKAVLASCWLITATASASAETLNAPAVNTGDTWVYRVTTEKATTGWSQTRDETVVTRVTPSSIYYTVKASGSTQPPKELFAGLDWSRVRDVNGKETIVNRPLSFPLTVGKTWDLEYTEPHPNKSFRTEEWGAKYSVVGFETIEVPAGKAFWYVPEVKRWVRSVEEYYGNGGVRNESYTGELESFKVD
jgi:hypothetical protein